MNSEVALLVAFAIALLAVLVGYGLHSTVIDEAGGAIGESQENLSDQAEERGIGSIIGSDCTRCQVSRIGERAA